MDFLFLQMKNLDDGQNKALLLYSLGHHPTQGLVISWKLE